MGSESTRFDGVVIASIGVVVGVTYLFGAMLAILSAEGDSGLLLANSIPVSTVVGVLLLLTAGLLAVGSRLGRFVGVVAFGVIPVFVGPSVVSPGPTLIAEGALTLVVALYMVFRNPVAKDDRSSVDESTSATRVGSTLR